MASVLTLRKNVLNQGYTSVHQDKMDFVYEGQGKPPISETDLRSHFVSEAKNLMELRRNNMIGYHEKWLHSLLIEKMQNDGLPGADLQFLYYEAPAGKIRRDKNRYARMHVDILAEERQSKALAIVEVKNDNLKFLIVAPDADFKNSSLDMDLVNNIKSLGCGVEALHLSDDWKKTEDVHVVKTDKL